MSDRDGSTRLVELSRLGPRAEELVDGLATGEGAVLVRETGEPAAVLLPIARYRELTHDLEVLRCLALGELECKAGVGHSLEQVLAECDLLLEEN